MLLQMRPGVKTAMPVPVVHILVPMNVCVRSFTRVMRMGGRMVWRVSNSAAHICLAHLIAKAGIGGQHECPGPRGIRHGI